MYKYLSVHLDPTMNLDTHFYKKYRQLQEEWIYYDESLFNTDTLSPERIYRVMIMPIFTYCGQMMFGWSETRRCRIVNLAEQRSHRIIRQSSKCLNCELRGLSTIEIVLKKKACLFVFDCLKCNVCSPFKNYFNFLTNFYFLGASAFNFYL